MRFEGTRWLLTAPHLFGEDSADVLDRFLEVLVGIAVVFRSDHVVPARPGRAEEMGVLGIDCIGADHVRLPVLPQSLEVAVHAVVVRGRDEIELTERELLKSGYVEEMEGIARSGEGDAAEARVFGYWQKLHKIADAESARIESRSVKREMRNAGFSAGVDRTIEVLRKIKDADLIEMRGVIEGVAKEVSDGRKE